MKGHLLCNEFSSRDLLGFLGDLWWSWPNLLSKVTIRSDFTGTVPNFDGLSWYNYRVSQGAELSRIPNPVPILSRFECNVASHVDKVYTYRHNTYNDSLSSDAFF